MSGSKPTWSPLLLPTQQQYSRTVLVYVAGSVNTTRMQLICSHNHTINCFSAKSGQCIVQVSKRRASLAYTVVPLGLAWRAALRGENVFKGSIYSISEVKQARSDPDILSGHSEAWRERRRWRRRLANRRSCLPQSGPAWRLKTTQRAKASLNGWPPSRTHEKRSSVTRGKRLLCFWPVECNHARTRSVLRRFC